MSFDLIDEAATTMMIQSTDAMQGRLGRYLGR